MNVTFHSSSKSPSLMAASNALSMPSMPGTITVETRNIGDNLITSGSKSSGLGILKVWK
jgi:hypothetical protein